jgi:hypothetical protein
MDEVPGIRQPAGQVQHCTFIQARYRHERKYSTDIMSQSAHRSTHHKPASAASATKCSAIQYRSIGGFLSDVLRACRRASPISPLLSVLLAFEQGSSAARRRFGRQGCHHAGVPWLLLGHLGPLPMGLPGPEVVCASHDVPQSLAEEAAVLLSKNCNHHLPSERSCWSFTPIFSSFKRELSPRAALPRGRPISIVAKPVRYPSVGQKHALKKKRGGVIT